MLIIVLGTNYAHLLDSSISGPIHFSKKRARPESIIERVERIFLFFIILL